MKKSLLVVSFGTSYRENCEKTIGAIERDLCAAFPDRALCRAWTSRFIRRKLLERDGLAVDSVQEALDRMQADGVTDVLVQPTHLMSGEEFSAVREEILAAAPRFDKLSLGRPLLAEREDIRILAKTLGEIFSFVKEDEMLALMGHGSAQAGAEPYLQLGEDLCKNGFGRFAVGTVEEEPGFSPILAKAEEIRPTKIFLAPLLVVAGDHANNDMAGTDADSWNSQLQGRGYATECILRGIGEYPQVRTLFIEHAREAERI